VPLRRFTRLCEDCEAERMSEFGALIELIRDSFVEIPRCPLPTREGAAFVAIKARELHCDRLVRAKRSKSGAVSFDLLDAEASHAGVQ
jgi:hypothetical protein